MLALLVAAPSCGRGDGAQRGGAAAAETPALQILGDSAKLRRDDPLPARSPIFDGERVRLRAVRGETLGVQVLLRDRTPTPVGLELAAAGVTVAPFHVDQIEVASPSTAMYGPSRGAGWYPDRMVPSGNPVSAERLAFFDIAVAADAPPGTVTGTVTVGDRRIPLDLRIEPLHIDLRADPLVWVWYKVNEIARVHGVPLHSRELLDWERRYADLFRAHGAYASTDLDLADWQDRAPFLEGIRHWPLFVDARSEVEFKRQIRAWIAALAGRDLEPFIIPIDEPLRPARQLEVRLLAGWAREAGSGPGRLLFAVTDVPRLVYGDRIDVYINPYAVVRRNRERVSGEPDVWTYNGGIPFAGGMIIDTDGTALRTWGWIAYRYDLPLWYAWEGMYFSDRYNDKQPTDVEHDPVTFADKEDHGNGDGLLAYPGALPSLRLKALRRGLEDRALLRLLASCGGQKEADTLAEKMIPAALGQTKKGQPPTWPTDEPSWEAARNTVIDQALLACGGQGQDHSSKLR